MSEANKIQIGGEHYKRLKPEPWDVISAWGLGYFDGNVIKYVARFRHKGGVESLKKARHYLDKLIEQIEAEERATDEERERIRSQTWPVGADCITAVTDLMMGSATTTPTQQSSTFGVDMDPFHIDEGNVIADEALSDLIARSVRADEGWAGYKPGCPCIGCRAYEAGDPVISGLFIHQKGHPLVICGDPVPPAITTGSAIRAVDGPLNFKFKGFNL